MRLAIGIFVLRARNARLFWSRLLAHYVDDGDDDRHSISWNDDTPWNEMKRGSAASTSARWRSCRGDILAMIIAPGGRPEAHSYYLKLPWSEVKFRGVLTRRFIICWIPGRWRDGRRSSSSLTIAHLQASKGHLLPPSRIKFDSIGASRCGLMLMRAICFWINAPNIYSSSREIKRADFPTGNCLPEMLREARQRLGSILKYALRGPRHESHQYAD